jgi:hypothetical protein
MCLPTRIERIRLMRPRQQPSRRCMYVFLLLDCLILAIASISHASTQSQGLSVFGQFSPCFGLTSTGPLTRRLLTSRPETSINGSFYDRHTYSAGVPSNTLLGGTDDFKFMVPVVPRSLSEAYLCGGTSLRLLSGWIVGMELEWLYVLQFPSAHHMVLWFVATHSKASR